jgi:hypothetical protein
VDVHPHTDLCASALDTLRIEPKGKGKRSKTGSISECPASASATKEKSREAGIAGQHTEKGKLASDYFSFDRK